VANLANVAHKTNECLYHIIIMHMVNMISKRMKASSRDIIMKETHMKEKWETKNNELVFKTTSQAIYQSQDSLLI